MVLCAINCEESLWFLVACYLPGLLDPILNVNCILIYCMYPVIYKCPGPDTYIYSSYIKLFIYISLSFFLVRNLFIQI